MDEQYTSNFFYQDSTVLSYSQRQEHRNLPGNRSLFLSINYIKDIHFVYMIKLRKLFF